MPDLKENSDSLLAQVTGIDMNTIAEIELYTVPLGKKAIITRIIVHSPSATLVGLDDVNFGGGAAGAGIVFLDNVTTIAGMTAVGDYLILVQAAGVHEELDGDDSTVVDRTLNMDMVDATTNSATASVSVFGILI